MSTLMKNEQNAVNTPDPTKEELDFEQYVEKYSDEIREIEEETLLDQKENSVDSMKQYFREISRYPLLTKEQEIELGEKVANGDNEAKQWMVKCNLRLAVSIAKRYRGRNMKFDDLIQEASIGLMKAVDHFDYTKGYKFSTYATYWIRQNIERSILDKSRNIRIPVHMQEEMQRIDRFKKEFERDNHRLPNDQEILKAFPRLNMEKLNNLHLLENDTSTLDQTVNDDNDTTLGELLQDQKIQEAGYRIIKEEFEQDIRAVLEVLTDREKEVIIMRYGFDDGIPKTLEEIGNYYHITRERVRQIEMNAIHKLKRPRNCASLAIYLDRVS